MRSIIFVVPIIVVAALGVSAQNARPTPTPAPEGEVVKISTNLIQLDVSVTDSKGKPISDLRPDEIEIYENGKKQKITNLSFVSAVRQVTEAPKKKDVPKIDIPIPTTEIRPENVRRTVALIVDDLTLSFGSAYYTRTALKKFVDEQMQDGDLVAIIRTGAGMGSLQQFTSDKKMLYAAIEKVRWNPMGTGGVGAFAAIEPTPLEQAAASGAEVSDEDIAAEKNRMNAADDFRNSIFAAGTLGAIRYVITGMSELPGRKSIIMFSDGFRMFTRDNDGNIDGREVLELLRKLVDFANRNSVVINTIDSRGLVYTGYTAADNVTNTSAQAAIEAMNERSDQLFETQQGLSFLADQTGGISIRNSNDLAGGVRKILDDQSYYLIAYEPDDATFDSTKVKFNKINVRVLRNGATARTRSGFYNNTSSRPAAGSANPASPFRQIMDALSSPFARTDIQLRLNPLFAYDEKQGTYVKSYLHIDAKNLKFVDQPDGNKKAAISIIAAAFDEKGLPTQDVSRAYSITVRPGGMKQILDDGFIYEFTFPVKKPGGFQYRVALRDDQSGTVGSANQFVQIPKIQKGRHVISGIVLQNFTQEKWKNAASQVAPDESINDTSLRRFSRGTVLQYAYEIYGIDPRSAKPSNLSRRIRIFRDGKLVLDGKEQPISPKPGPTGRITDAAAIAIGSEMEPGDYVLQVIVTDNSQSEKKKYATQFVQFEIAN
jgi:VWFA-related protein